MTAFPAFFGRAAGRVLIVLCAGAVLPLAAHAQTATKKKNPTSKFYVADVDGEAQIDTGDRVDDLNKKSVYNAEGTVIETKPKASNAMVFSNGTGIFFDEDTRVEVKHFEQEPFVPNRTDMETEPSISQTQAYLPRGTVGLCTSKLVAGSNMTYRTALGAVNIRGGKVVIQSTGGVTKISMLEGESTVLGGNVNTGGHPLKDGQQAIITAGAPGMPPHVHIQDIPHNEKSSLEGRVTMACTAKKTVYFAAVNSRDKNAEAATAVTATASSSDTVFNSTPDKLDGAGTTNSSPITAFDGDSANVPTTTTTIPHTDVPQVIVPVPVVPTNLPVQYTVSPAGLTTATSP